MIELPRARRLRDLVTEFTPDQRDLFERWLFVDAVRHQIDEDLRKHAMPGFGTPSLEWLELPCAFTPASLMETWTHTRDYVAADAVTAEAALLDQSLWRHRLARTLGLYPRAWRVVRVDHERHRAETWRAAAFMLAVILALIGLSRWL